MVTTLAVALFRISCGIALASWWYARPWRVRTALAIAVLVSGCVDERDPHTYRCALLFRCIGETNVQAIPSTPCAEDIDDAREQATWIGRAEFVSICGPVAEGVVALCEEQQPHTTCDPRD